MHAAAGLCFVMVLSAWVRQQDGRVGALIALGGAALFLVANAGEALTGLEIFVPLYAIGLLMLCLGVLAAGIARLVAPSPLPDARLLIMLGAFPLTFAAQALPEPAAWILTDAAWLLFGLGWGWLGIVHSR